MQNVKLKCYETPTLSELGNLKEITQNGNAGNSDTLPFVDNTAFGPEALGS